LPKRYHSNISLKLSDYERVKRIAAALNCSLPEVIKRLVEYCEKHNCIEELKSSKTTAIKATTPTSPKLKGVPGPRPKVPGPKPATPNTVVIDLGYRQFILTRGEWELLKNTVIHCYEPYTRAILDKLPGKLKNVFYEMYRMLVIRYDADRRMWVIDYNRLKSPVL